MIINNIFRLERGNITLLDINKDKCVISIKFKNKSYDIDYYIEDSGDVEILQNEISKKMDLAWKAEPICLEWIEESKHPDFDDDWSLVFRVELTEELMLDQIRENVAKIPPHERFRFKIGK